MQVAQRCTLQNGDCAQSSQSRERTHTTRPARLRARGATIKLEQIHNNQRCRGAPTEGKCARAHTHLRQGGKGALSQAKNDSPPSHQRQLPPHLTCPHTCHSSTASHCNAHMRTAACERAKAEEVEGTTSFWIVEKWHARFLAESANCHPPPHGQTPRACRRAARLSGRPSSTDVPTGPRRELGQTEGPVDAPGRRRREASVRLTQQRPTGLRAHANRLHVRVHDCPARQHPPVNPYM